MSPPLRPSRRHPGGKVAPSVLDRTGVVVRMNGRNEPGPRETTGHPRGARADSRGLGVLACLETSQPRQPSWGRGLLTAPGECGSSTDEHLAYPGQVSEGEAFEDVARPGSSDRPGEDEVTGSTHFENPTVDSVCPGGVGGAGGACFGRTGPANRGVLADVAQHSARDHPRAPGSIGAEYETIQTPILGHVLDRQLRCSVVHRGAHLDGGSRQIVDHAGDFLVGHRDGTPRDVGYDVGFERFQDVVSGQTAGSASRDASRMDLDDYAPGSRPFDVLRSFTRWQVVPVVE